MNWDDIRLALSIARGGSLSRAAIALDINQSTVGRRLNALEASLGVTLFLRSKNGLRLTDMGEVFIANAAEIERQAEGLSDALKSPEQQAAGILRVLGNQWVINRLIKSGLGELLERYPSLQIRTIAGRPETSLWRGEPGVGLWFETQPVDGSFQITLGAIPYAVYRKKGCDGGRWVSFFDERNPGNQASVRVIGSGGGNARTRLTALDAETLLEAVAAGMGNGLLPVCLAEGDDRLEQVSSTEQPFQRILFCHIHPDTVGSPRVQAFMTWIRARFDVAFRPREPELGTVPVPGYSRQ
ncbi:LysR family transcriptional regulator [Rhodophyticola porphyridii]|uniref:LysR family transcriptional regulator n=1 Tax=Rhodophyticola porphyridii TaxID=1852017 RepID=UPI0035D0E130